MRTYKPITRILLFWLLCALVAPSLATSADTRPKFLLILSREGGDQLHIDGEIGVMIQVLEEADFEVVVASHSGRQLLTLKPDLKLKDVKVADYAGFILPCVGQNNIPLPGNEPVDIVKQAVAEGKPVAAQRGAVEMVLGPDGVLEGKKYGDFFASVPGGIYAGSGVVQDGKIVTAGWCIGGQSTTTELTQRLVNFLTPHAVERSENKRVTTWGAIKQRID